MMLMSNLLISERRTIPSSKGEGLATASGLADPFICARIRQTQNSHAITTEERLICRGWQSPSSTCTQNPNFRVFQGCEWWSTHFDVDERHVVDGGEALHELAARLVALLCYIVPNHGARCFQVEEVANGDGDAAVGNKQPLKGFPN